jgi:hypothetical protein
MFVGTVTKSAPNTGGWEVSITGATFALAAGYTTDSDPNPSGLSPALLA